MCNALILVVVAQTKLASDDGTTQEDLAADSEYLYTAALHLTVCTL